MLLFIFALSAYHFLPAGEVGGGSSSLSGTSKNTKSYLSPEKTIRDRHPTSMKISKDPPPPTPTNTSHLLSNTKLLVKMFQTKKCVTQTIKLKDKNIMGNKILREKACIILAFRGNSWQKMLLKKKKNKQKKNHPAPCTFEQTLAEPALIHYLGKIKTPPQHTHTHTQMKRRPPLCAGKN